MPQKLVQSQEQKLAQQQRLTQQQVLQVKLLEMPLAEFEQNVQLELDDNPALETTPPDDFNESNDYEQESSTADAEESFEMEERADALDNALKNMTQDDEMPVATSYQEISNYQGAEMEEQTFGDPTSFYDKLQDQMRELVLTEEQQDMMEYLIGSLDDDGLLRKDLQSISDELAVYYNIDCSEKDLEDILQQLQTFDPPGIGARTLQECLLLQIDRKPESPTKELQREVITKYYSFFLKKQWRQIAQEMKISEDIMRQVQNELIRLNPKPGASLGETIGRNLQQITPDFIVDTAEDGTISFYINKGKVPDLYISPSFTDMLKEYKNNKDGMSRQVKEALLYAKEKVDRAKGFIEAIRQRRHTMYITMKTIIDLQRPYFLSGDENDLRPMVLKDVAERTNLDISTISRVCNMKYAQTRWGTFRLRHFFSEGVKVVDGETLSNRKLKSILKDIVEHEDKQHPLNDDAIAQLMKEKGSPIARRTVSKYREQLGIPTARLRKE